MPMLESDELVGILFLNRQEVRPFTDKQIELVKNFAAQAVIAIENARSLNALRQRTTDLTEALEQQTATSEVLEVISSSPGELEPVFAAMLGSATSICEAKFGNLFLREGDTFRAVAWHGGADIRRELAAGATDYQDRRTGHSSRTPCGNEAARSRRRPQAGRDRQGRFCASCDPR